MKKVLLFLNLLLIGYSNMMAQVTCDPVFPTVDDDVTIYYNANEGNGALAATAPPIYLHAGVITNLSTSGTDWKHVATAWATNNATSLMTTVSPGIYKKTFNIRTFFGIQANETVLKMAFVFRNGTGTIVGRSSDGSDLFYTVYPANSALLTTFVKPTETAIFKNIGQQITVQAAASQSAELALFDNGISVSTATGKTLEATINVTETGLHEVAFVAKTATATDTSFFTYIVPGAQITENPPVGTELGLNVINNSNVRLALLAPNKQIVYAIGDFSNWLPLPNYQMKRSVDGKTWWIDIPVTAGQPMRYQYLVDGTLKIADPYSDLVLDPWNDSYIPAVTFPNMPAYPAGKTQGLVSIFTTGQAPFNWEANAYVRPKKTDLVVYELLVRDFLARHDYATMLDTLDYLDRLGVTAIELMPVNEFDGNINWGYSPAFHKALDKYYGSPEVLKTFIDECHKRGIAVILDVVFNHTTGASPLAQLYWDAANSRPAANNPWLNPIAKHDFNVYYDFNHESADTKYYVKRCLKYWLQEYRMDGFRFDLSKGFTQKNTLGNTGAWGQYDATRITILKDYADYMWSIDPTSYTILEHFADNSEEKVLANYGMMLWGNMQGAYKEMALGTGSSVAANFTGVSYKQRQWNSPHLIGYMESHDEERIGYECKTYGNTAPGYNVKSLPITTARIEMNNNLFYTIPGPKMLWQFGELAYDFSINWCANGTNNSNCRTDPKPIRWDYYVDPYRRHLYDQTRALLHLRRTQDIFETTDFQILSTNSGRGRLIKLNSPTLNALAISNIATTAQNTPTLFHHTGWWYDYYTGDSINVTGITASISLQAGEYRLYFDKLIPLPDDIDLSTSAPETKGNLARVIAYPNPTSGVLNVDYTLLQSSDVRIELFDFAGKMVKQIADEPQTAGEQQIAIQLDVPNGVYILKISTENGAVLVKKILKQ